MQCAAERCLPVSMKCLMRFSSDADRNRHGSPSFLLAAMGRSVEADDPLAAAIAPPADETVEERAARERREAEAKRVSDGIDENLRAERAAAKKKRKPVKVLLLGQSESGELRVVRRLVRNTLC